MSQPLSRSQRARVEEVFGEAADLPEQERAAFVERACADDAAVREEVLELLAALGEPSRAELSTQAMQQRVAQSAGIPTAIGPFQLTRPLGDGGFGTVWHAVQTEPVRREVAIKLIKPGMDTAEVLRRFERERQTLAQLDHPNIARIIDAGQTPRQHPYFVMDYVAGTHITTYCDAQGLTIAGRLELFLQVCAAVQHAHQKGVIHRDLKPSNVLVSASEATAHVRVIDFGIARALSEGEAEQEQLTRPASIIGTPAYMSPEQTHAPDRVDTRTDVYALGVLLYQLLAGTLPFEGRGATRSGSAGGAGVQEAAAPSARMGGGSREREAIAAARGSSVAALRKVLRGELDWIVLKAMAPERDRRYAAVSEFAEDIRRYLRREPISAGPPSAWYRVRKFAERNRGLVAAVAVVAFAIVGSLVGVSVALQRALAAEAEAQRAGERALQQAARADSLNEFLIEDILASASPEAEGHTLTVVEAIANGLATVDERFGDQPLQHATIRHTIGQVYRQLGLIDAALENLRRARAILSDAAGGVEAERILVDGALGTALLDLDQLQEAEPLLRDAYARAQAALGAHDVETLRIARSLGEALQKMGRHDEGQQILRMVIAALRARDDHDHALIFAALSSLVASLSATGDEQEAGELAGELHAAATKVYPRTHPVRLAALNNYASSLADLQQLDEAQVRFAELVRDAEEALPEGHWQIGLARYGYGSVLGRSGMHEQAVEQFSQAYAILSAALGPTHHFSELSLTTLYGALTATGQTEEARQYHRLALETRLMAAPPDQRARLGVALARYVERLVGDEELSEDAARDVALRELAERCEEMLADDEPYAVRFAWNLGALLVDIERLEQAERWLRTAYERAAENEDVAGAIAAELAEVYARLGRADEAGLWRGRSGAAE